MLETRPMGRHMGADANCATGIQYGVTRARVFGS